MKFSSWLSSWTRRADWSKNTRRTAGRRNSAAQFGHAEVSMSAEPLEPRLVLDASTPVDDLAAFAKALKNGGATLYGAAWDATTTAQRQLFGDGAQFLNFVEVTNADHSLNSTANANNITTTSPTWVFADQSRLVGNQTLAALAAQANIAIPQGFTPGMATIATQTLLAGSPLMIPLDGFDPNGDDLTYSVTVNQTSPVLTATLRPRVGALKITVAGYGEMLIDTFDDLVPRVTERLKELADSGFYDGLTFHRVLNNFVIQGGDPNGNGTGGTGIIFNDQFSVDLQHNRTGLISMAKSTDDTNDSQFFITEGPIRSLDFNHSIFGLVVEGESVRDAISNLGKDLLTNQFPNPAGTNASDKPLIPVTMQTVDVVVDNENGVLMLKAAEGTTGTATVTVQVTDTAGNFSEQTFTVNVTPDTFNSSPFLEDIPFVRALQNTPLQMPLQAIDVDPNAANVAIQFRSQATNANQLNVSVGGLNGIVTLTPVNGFVGSQTVTVMARLVSLDNNGYITGAGQDDIQFFPVEVVSAATTLAISANDDPRHDAADDGTPDSYLVRVNNGLLEVTINGKVAILANISSVTDLIIEGSTDSDTVTVDITNGDPCPNGVIQFHGDSQPSGGQDQLILKNGSATTLQYTLTGLQDGSLLVNSTPQVTFTGLEAISDLLTSNNRIIQYPVGGASAALSVDTTATNQARLDFGSNLSLSFRVPTNALTVNGDAGADALTLNFANGSPVPGGGVLFQGGDQPLNLRDQLEITGTTAVSVFHTVTGESSGFVTINGATLVGYNGTESVVDELAATNRGFQFDSTADNLVLSDDGIAANGKSKLTFGTKEFVFTNPTGSLSILAGGGDDTINGAGLDSSFSVDANVFLQGEAGHDSIDTSSASRAFLMFGGAGNDLIVGNGSDESIPMDLGDDTINGNGGIDRIVAQGLRGAVTLNDTLLSGLGLDSIAGIELAQLEAGAAVQINASAFSGAVTLFGSSAGDSLIGTAFADVISGGNGNDTINAGDGNDTITGGVGNDSIDGEGGTDLQAETTAGSVLVTAIQIQGGNPLGTDKYFNLESMQFTGNAGANKFDTRLFSGNVTLLGGGGNDTLCTGGGNDSLAGEGGNDFLTGGAGDDTLDGGDGGDRLIEAANNDWTLTNSALTGLGTDTISFFEQASLTGGAGGNTLNATGYTGNATLDGATGDDTILGGSGASSLVGNDGNDSLVGGIGADTVLGGNGTDTLNGGDGNDSVDGGAGINDRVTGGAGNDRLSGGAGIGDLLIETSDASLITLTANALNGNGSDIIGTFEIAILTGGNSNNTINATTFAGSTSLTGAAGNDVLIAGAGASTLNGGAGNDTLTGGKLNDSLIGGDDNDLLVEAGNGSITAGNPPTGTELQGDAIFGTDRYSDIERIQLTGGSSANRFDLALFAGSVTLRGGSGNDTLIGGSLDDFLNGEAGNDLLKGGLGNDSMSGDAGNDTLNGGDGNDSLDGGTGSDALAGYLGNDLLQGGTGADSLHGGDGNDTLLGGNDKDFLIGGLGDDSVNGELGDDSVTGGTGGNAAPEAADIVLGSAAEINNALTLIFAWINDI